MMNTRQAVPEFPLWDETGSVTDAVRLKLARNAYARGNFRLASNEICGFSHLMTSRQGFFALGLQGWKLIAHGLFFGMVTTPDAIFLFESGDLARNGTDMGRIVRLDLVGDRIEGWQIVAEGLSSGCHQIDLIEDRIFVVDTYNQAIRWFALDGSASGAYHPFAPAARNDWAGGYLHVNSLLAVRDARLLLLHNGGSATGRASELAVLDEEWQLMERRPLPGRGCHNLALRPDGTLLTCASLTGELINLSGERVLISEMMTRGLSVAPDGIVVGASAFSNRLQRHEANGEVHFLSPDLMPLHRFNVPAAPTDIRRLAGVDLGQSAQALAIMPNFG